MSVALFDGVFVDTAVGDPLLSHLGRLWAFR
jgi:hypothetical protein